MIKNIIFSIFLISSTAFAKFTVDGKDVVFGRKKIADQYQCSAQKNSNVVGMLTDANGYLLQAVATSDRQGIREVSGVISDHSALAKIESENFLSWYSMPPIHGEGKLKQVPQGNVWNGVSQMSAMIHAQPNGYYNMGGGFAMAGNAKQQGSTCAGISCTVPSFNSTYKSWEEKSTAARKDYEEQKKDLDTAAVAAAKLKYPEPDPNDMRPGGRAAREKLPGQIAAETKRAGDQIEKLKDPGALPGALAAKQSLPGHIAGKEKLPGHAAGAEVVAGNKAMGEVKAGDKAYYDNMFKKPVPRQGENIGKDGITTFSALYDGQGNLKKVVYRTGRDITKTINAGDKGADQDPIVSKLKAQSKRFQTYAGCCKNDSRKECVIKHEPEIKPSVEPVIPRDHGPSEPGGAMFNPFGGSR